MLDSPPFLVPLIPSLGRVSVWDYATGICSKLVHELANGGWRAVIVVQARGEFRTGVVLLLQRGRRRDVGEVELDEVLLVEVRERLPEEVDPVPEAR